MVGYSISQSVQYVVTSNTPVTEKVKNAIKTSVLKLMHIVFYQLLYEIYFTNPSLHGSPSYLMDTGHAYQSISFQFFLFQLFSFFCFKFFQFLSHQGLLITGRPMFIVLLDFTVFTHQYEFYFYFVFICLFLVLVRYTNSSSVGFYVLIRVVS